MEYKVQIGSVAFRIETPFPYRWQPADERFLHWDGTAEKTVQVIIRSGEIELPARAPDTVAGQTDIWQAPREEIRAYRGVFWPGQPLYALSRRQGDRVDITFSGEMALWDHPNMQLWNLIHLENFLQETGGIVLHSCYIAYRDRAVLFTAPSGTGKTTQANIWKRYCGAEIINGDKCLLRRIGGQWMAAGFPLHGSADECENRSYPISAIAVVRQAARDRVEQLSPARALGLIYSECTVNSWDNSRVNGALSLLTDLVTQVPTVALHCTMEVTAARVLHDHIFGETHGTV